MVSQDVVWKPRHRYRLSPCPALALPRALAAAVHCAEYVLHQRKEADHWQETPISTVQPVYTVRELECGTTYQFYMTAHNSLGRSEPSDVIRAKTDGAGKQRCCETSIYAAAGA